MATMKTFAVDVEITIKTTVYVDARRPNGALEKLATDAGWQEALNDRKINLQFERRAATKMSVRGTV